MANQLIDAELVLAKELHRQQVRCSAEEQAVVWPMLTATEQEYYYRLARNELTKQAVLVPVDSAFTIGQRVRKAKGYRFPGIVIGVSQKLDGRLLYLVECIAPDCAGMCHIYSEKDLEHDKETEVSTAGQLSQIS